MCGTNGRSNYFGFAQQSNRMFVVCLSPPDPPTQHTAEDPPTLTTGTTGRDPTTASTAIVMTVAALASVPFSFITRFAMWTPDETEKWDVSLSQGNGPASNQRSRDSCWPTWKGVRRDPR